MTENAVVSELKNKGRKLLETIGNFSSNCLDNKDQRVQKFAKMYSYIETMIRLELLNKNYLLIEKFSYYMNSY